jgi:hypothetical protein
VGKTGLMPVILTTWEAEIWRITVQGQPGQTVCEIPTSKNNHRKMDWKCGTSGRVPSSTSQDTWCPVFPALRQLPFTVGTHSCLHGRPGSPESPWAQPPPLTSHWTEPPEVGALSITVPATAILKLSHCDSHPYGPGYHKGSISVSVPFIHSFVHSTSTF